jgi:hypothetical protein
MENMNLRGICCVLALTLASAGCGVEDSNGPNQGIVPDKGSKSPVPVQPGTTVTAGQTNGRNPVVPDEEQQVPEQAAPDNFGDCASGPNGECLAERPADVAGDKAPGANGPGL